MTRLEFRTADGVEHVIELATEDEARAFCRDAVVHGVTRPQEDGSFHHYVPSELQNLRFSAA